MTTAAAQDFQKMYDAAPVSLWIDDYSAVKAMLDQLRAAGIDDFPRYLDANPDFVDRAIAAIRIVDMNRTTLHMFKAESKDELFRRLGEVLRGDMRASFRSELVSLWNGELDLEIESVNYALDGTPLDILLRRGVLPGHEVGWDRVLISIIDISDRKRSERELAASQEYAAALFEYSPVSLWIEDYSALRAALQGLRDEGVDDLSGYLVDHPGATDDFLRLIKVIDVNTRTVELLRAKDKVELMSRLSEVFGNDVAPHFGHELISIWNNELRHERESVNFTLTGEPIDIHLQWSVLPGHESTWDRVLVSIADITGRKRAEAYMHYLGTHDSLTGLYNRAFYDDTLGRLAVDAAGPISVVVVDLNDLKQTNDAQGHPAGDALIRRAAEVLKAVAQNDDVVARIGGDEFAIVLPGKDAHDAADLLRRIDTIVEVNNQFYRGPRLSMSSGTATASTGADLAEAHRLADQRMYVDKGDRRRSSAVA